MVAGTVITSSAEFQAQERLAVDAVDDFNVVQLGEQRRQVARDRVVDDLAEAIYTSMTEGF